MHKGKTKILISSLHYCANKYDGSEYSRVYDYLIALGERKDLSGDVIVGYMKEKKVGNFKIHTIFPKKPLHISALIRMKYIVLSYLKCNKLLSKNTYDYIWHTGPFAINETFSLISIKNRKRIPFIIGPIVTPHKHNYSDELRSMGNKNVAKMLNTTPNLMKRVEHHLYRFSFIFTPLSTMTLKMSSKILVKDSEGKKILERKGLKNIKVVDFVVNLDNFYHKKNKTSHKSFVSLATTNYLVKRKRVDEVMKGIRNYINKYKSTKVKLLVIGDGPELHNLKNLSNQLKLQNFVQFLGFVKKDKIPDLYKSTDIFVSASKSDSMPAMYFEAMASSLALIVAKNSSTKELLDNGMGGEVVEGNFSYNFPKQLFRLVKDKDTTHNYGAKNYLIAKEKYNFNTNFNRFIDKLTKKQ